MSSSYVSDNSPLLYMSFASVFSQSMACFLILFQVSFTEEFLTLMKSSLSIISFMDHAFDVVSKVSSPYADSSRFSPVIFLEFYSLWFTFRSMINFELILGQSIRCMSRFIFFFFM